LTVESAPDPADPLIYSIGFEASEGFTAGTTYNNASIKFDGPIGQQWGTYYGTASTNAPIMDSMSMQMRWYTTAVANLGYTFTDFNTSNIGTIKFNAKSTNSLRVEVSISTATSNTGWSEAEIFTLTGTSAEYIYNVPASYQSQEIRIRFRIILPGTNPTSTSSLFIDNVRFYIPE
jgi:hypothetical protein